MIIQHLILKLWALLGSWNNLHSSGRIFESHMLPFGCKNSCKVAVAGRGRGWSSGQGSVLRRRLRFFRSMSLCTWLRGALPCVHREWPSSCYSKCGSTLFIESIISRFQTCTGVRMFSWKFPEGLKVWTLMATHGPLVKFLENILAHAMIQQENLRERVGRSTSSIVYIYAQLVPFMVVNMFYKTSH